MEKCKGFPSVTYVAVDREGAWRSNIEQTAVNAVTWGVFPAKEIIQPTVVDPSSFVVWKDEAFEIWSRGWARLYPEGDPSRKLLEEVCDFGFVYVHNILVGFDDVSRDVAFAGANQLFLGELGGQ